MQPNTTIENTYNKVNKQEKGIRKYIGIGLHKPDILIIYERK